MSGGVLDVALVEVVGQCQLPAARTCTRGSCTRLLPVRQYDADTLLQELVCDAETHYTRSNHHNICRCCVMSAVLHCSMSAVVS
jgi:hypothetical protein